jgi:hypothetical protein
MSQVSPSPSDPPSFLTGLVESLGKALPDAIASGVLIVERDRSLGDRLAGRPGTVTGIRLEAAGEALTLRYSSGPRWIPELARVSGGVTISRRSLPLGDWLTTFAGRVAAVAADLAGDAAASARALQDLGIQPAGNDIQVSEVNLIGDLRSLPGRLGGRVPDQAVATVAAIAELLADTLPRVEGGGEAEIIVRRTATIYLPDTIRAYLSLPADWVSRHVFPDGMTPEQSFVAQLSTIEAAASRMHESAVEQDASALLTNGRFLSGRFATSSLDLT